MWWFLPYINVNQPQACTCPLPLKPPSPPHPSRLSQSTSVQFSESESQSVMYDSLRSHGLYNPRNSLGQNTGVGSCPLLQGIFLVRNQTQVSHIAGRFLTSWATREPSVHWIMQQISTGYCFTYGNVYVSVALSQEILPSLLPPLWPKLYSSGLSPSLSRKKDHPYHLSRFHIYALIYDTCLYLSD